MHFFNVCLYFPRLILRGGWGCAQFCWTPLMMVILKGPNCHTATEDCTQEHPAPQIQDPPIPVMGSAVAEVLIEDLWRSWEKSPQQYVWQWDKSTHLYTRTPTKNSTLLTAAVEGHSPHSELLPIQSTHVVLFSVSLCYSLSSQK